MRAAVIDRNGDPRVIRLAEIPDPVVRPGGLIVEVHAIGLQGGDLINRERGELVTRPHVVGYQASGIVRIVGDGVDSFAPGDRVVAMMMYGSHAQLVSVSAKRTWHLPSSLSFAEAACVPVEFGTAHDCLFEFGHLRAGETVLVQGGTGGVGLPAVQLAKRCGATVIATAGDEARLERLGEFGLDHGIEYRTRDVAAEVMRLTDGRGADLVVDPVGGEVLETSIAALAYRGRISWVGNAGNRAGDVRPDVWQMMEKNATLTALFLAMEMSRNTARVHAMVADMIDQVALGELRVVIDRTFSLAEAAEAHHYAESASQFGRIVIVP